MQAGRVVVGLALLAGATGLIVNAPGTRGRADDLQALSAAAVAGAAVAVWMWPWRKSLVAVCFLLFAWLAARYLVQDGAAPITVGAAVVLLVVGFVLRGLFRLTPEEVRKGLASPAAAERAHAMSQLRFLLVDEYGVGMNRGMAVLQEALGSGDAKVQELARALAGDLGDTVREQAASEPEDTYGRDAAGEPEEEARVDDPKEANVPPPLPTALAPGDPDVVEFDGPPPPPSIESLVQVLRDGEPTPCRKAVAQLVQHGEAAVPALKAAAEEGNPDLRIDAMEALRQIRGELPP